MRWVLLLGVVGLFGGALWLGGRRGGDAIGLALLCLPPLVLFGAAVVPELPGLWPHLVLWLGFATIGWYGLRSGARPKPVVVAGLVAVAAVAAWYAVAYVPAEISRSLGRQRDQPAAEDRMGTWVPRFMGATYTFTHLLMCASGAIHGGERASVRRVAPILLFTLSTHTTMGHVAPIMVFIGAAES
jgi:hypothetical protein